MGEYPQVGLFLSRAARDYYQFDDALFASSGAVEFTDFYAARRFAQQINERRDVAQFPASAVAAGHINALGILNELTHLMINHYRNTFQPQLIAEALAWAEANVGAAQVEETLFAFCEQFPPAPVYSNELDVASYVAGETDGVPNRETLFETLLVLSLSNDNPAFAELRDLFDDTDLKLDTAYQLIVTHVTNFFELQTPLGPNQFSLLRWLKEPARRHPRSLAEQLAYIQEEWVALLPTQQRRILGGLDLLAEEARQYVGTGGGPPPAGPPPPFFAPDEQSDAPFPPQTDTFYNLHADYQADPEPEQFSPDLDWMPHLVLLAKNAYVWLDQLSKKYQRHIQTLDQIPDEELDELAASGITGLWLIGLWERSEASKRIKHLCGNPDAVASAYSLDDYNIATALGGDWAYDQLRERARARGVRLSSDMVPNHMGIDARWVIEHPDWFVSLPFCPYPSYTFNGPNLSSDERVEIYLEDHYYSKTDAAVVFKRVDNQLGEARYIYHGNDGTAMPWNDTAQLDFLNPEVREAVIQTILHVARRSSVIRFDAAMVLAKRHIHRLWHPEPGSGEGVPSRAEFGMTRAEFDQHVPVEFWREVVDRVAAEVPDTLLLAEAFWLMEGYFVRTLGMHRVYNSAFMHMMRDEKNGTYRNIMRDTLAFNPEILKRYVNFMNNPDEDTAVEQFGRGDKYFGVATLLATLPGLPMIGHGQIEGYVEKYGMEYQRAYFDEAVDETLVERHKREIFPLLHRRYLFADVAAFLLYDFQSMHRVVDENVFAYSNRSGSERALVIYNNSHSLASGTIRRSVPYSVQTGATSDERTLKESSLNDGLKINSSPNGYIMFRDHVTGLEYIRSNYDLAQHGLSMELGPYQYHVFVDFHEVFDDDARTFTRLNGYLNGQGVPSLQAALQELRLEPILAPYRDLVNSGLFHQIISSRHSALFYQTQLLDTVSTKLGDLLTAIHTYCGSRLPDSVIADEIDALTLMLTAQLQIESLGELALLELLPDGLVKREQGSGQPAGATSTWATFLGWLFSHRLSAMVDADKVSSHSRILIDEWLLYRTLGTTLLEMGIHAGDVGRSLQLIRLLTSQQAWCHADALTPSSVLDGWLSDQDIRDYLQINEHEEVLWFNKESFEQLCSWMLAIAAAQLAAAEEDADGYLDIDSSTLLKIDEEDENPIAVSANESDIDSGGEEESLATDVADESDVAEAELDEGEDDDAWLDDMLDEEFILVDSQLSDCVQLIEQLLLASDASGYQVDKLRQLAAAANDTAEPEDTRLIDPQ